MTFWYQTTVITCLLYNFVWTSNETLFINNGAWLTAAFALSFFTLAVLTWAGFQVTDLRSINLHRRKTAGGIIRGAAVWWLTQRLTHFCPSLFFSLSPPLSLSLCCLWAYCACEGEKYFYFFPPFLHHSAHTEFSRSLIWCCHTWWHASNSLVLRTKTLFILSVTSCVSLCAFVCVRVCSLGTWERDDFHDEFFSVDASRRQTLPLCCDERLVCV